jgi:hypothetical protein
MLIASNLAAASLASYTVSRGAPTMHPGQRSMSRRTSSGTSPRVTTSDTARRRVRDERKRVAGFAHRRQATGQSWRVRVWEFHAANTGKRARPVVKLLVEGPRLSVIPLAVVIRTAKQTFEEARASLGLGIVIVHVVSADVGLTVAGSACRARDLNSPPGVVPVSTTCVFCKPFFATSA